VVVWGPKPAADEAVRVPAEIVERALAIEEADDQPVTLEA
jgi:hypothetical protein